MLKWPIEQLVSDTVTPEVFLVSIIENWESVILLTEPPTYVWTT